MPVARHEIRHEIPGVRIAVSDGAPADRVTLVDRLSGRFVVVVLGVLALVACGGTVEPGPVPVGSDGGADAPTAQPDAASAPDATPDASDGACWRCADRAWRNVCVVPAERGTDAESCLHCGEHCDSTADGG